jgi:O-antigen/teichoic acid export membrane protein
MRVARLKYLARSLASTSSPATHLIFTSGTNLLLALLGLVTGSCAARLLGPAGRGELAAIQMWPTVLATVGNLGLPHALTFYSAQSTEQAGRYLGSASVLILLASVPFMAAGYVFLPHALSAQPLETIAAARWYLLLLPIQGVCTMPSHLLRGRSDFAVWNALRLAPGLGWLAILLLGWSKGWTQPALFAFLFLAVMALLGIPSILIVHRRVPGPFRADPHQMRPMLAYGVPSMLTSVPQLLNWRLDQMLMAAFLPTQILGLYVVAVTWSSAVGQLPSALGTVLFPKTAAQREPHRRSLVVAQGSRLAVLSAVSVGTGVALITPWAIPLLFGDKFAAAVPAGLVLVGAAAISAINLVLEEGLRGLGRPAVALWAELGGLLVTAVALLTLLMPFGIMGAAVASVLGYGAVMCALAVCIRRLTGCSFTTLFWPSQRDMQRIREQVQLQLAAKVVEQAG